ncbi:Eukaryotic translation initiation factor 3 subunit E [Zea mays]|uniref:Eukaryotic translation initiation factor 3 subunit E n=1 Tax=Zea mays TaxID=4577 RepID=A0A1D6I4U3_MAIZE|nr:Eukaryotic translation initiation factor 3 subunit E [Zea mays]
MIGAAVGAVFGGSAAYLINSALPGNAAVAQPQAYALVGMAATLASVCSVPLTSVLLLFELTKDYMILLPLMTLRSVLTRLKLCISMPNFSLSVVTTQGLLITFTSMVLCAQTVSEMYLNAIQTNAHHLIRYLATAVVVNKRRRNMLTELIKVIQQEHHSYKDPVTEFLECLYVNYVVVGF